ncbi:hypothetical protein Btru_069567 [Bulinus truncatus]|nr:hypothetical protein Btru_069567 [Bulinus truncatus]
MPSENWTFDSTLAEDSTRNSSFITTDYNIKREESVVESQIAYHLLSYFLIFKMEPVTLPDKDVSAKINNLRRNIMNDPLCFIGDSAEVIATPFGSQNPSVFFNTYSHGVISNVHGAYDCWIITDARCIPGSEAQSAITIGWGRPHHRLTTWNGRGWGPGKGSEEEMGVRLVLVTTVLIIVLKLMGGTKMVDLHSLDWTAEYFDALTIRDTGCEYYCM